MSRKPRIWINAAVLLLAGAWQCGALASTRPAGDDAGGITVRFGDLNLEQPRGVTVLYRRLTRAAEHVCGEPERPGEAILSADWRACVAQAVERAVVTVDRPALTAYHREHTRSDHETLTARR
ncbi:MAG: UrcA family protein [Steroidobacteraceae bacterium]